MKSHLNLSQNAGVEIVRPAKPQATSGLNPRGRFQVEHWRDGQLIGEFSPRTKPNDEALVAAVEQALAAGGP